MRPTTRQDWLAAAALLAGLGATYLVPPATTGHSAARAIAAMVVASLLAFAVARAPFVFAAHIRTAFALLVALAAWYVASRLWADDPAGSMVESSRVSGFVLMAWAAHTTVIGTAARRALLAGVALCAAAVSAPPLWDLLREGAPTERIAGELGYWNATAGAAMCLVPVAVALAGTGSRRLIAVAALLIPIAGVAAVATASRGALVALAVGLLFQALLDPDYRGSLPRAAVAAASLGITVFGLATDRVPEAVPIVATMVTAAVGFALIRRRRQRREAPALTEARPRRRMPRTIQVISGVLVTALVVLLAALVYDANDKAIPSRSPEATSDATRLASTGDSKRLEWWGIGLDLWKESPLEGRGGGAFALDEIGDDVRPRPEHVHSMPLEILLETGIIGSLLLIAATVQLLRVLRRGQRTVERSLAGAIAALLLFQSLVDWTLSFPQLLALLAIAGPLALQSPPDPDEPQDGPTSLPAALTMLASLAIATTVALTPMLAALLSDQSVEQFEAGKPAEAAELAEQSLELVPSLETLQLQVLYLQRADKDAAARRVLRENRQVWSTQLSGLRLAQGPLADDRELGPEINRRIRQAERARAGAAQ